MQVSTKTTELAWRDIANVNSGENVRLKVVPRQKDLSMFHCQMLENKNAGMMGKPRLCKRLN